MASLPSTAFEEYMLCDDRRAYPKTGIFRLRLSGRLDVPAFEAALDTAVQRHPLMRATVRRRPGRRPRWIDNPNWRPAVQRESPLNAYGYPSAAYMDLTKEPRTRIWVVQRNGATDVVAQIHHSCADALGMCQVIEDLLVGYASNVGGGPAGASLRELDTIRLKRRGEHALSPWKLLCVVHREVMRLLGKTPLPHGDGQIVAGDVVLEGVDFVMSLRPDTSVAVCVYTYADRLSVMMHHDPRVLSDDRSQRLLELYLRQIHNATGSIARDLT